MVAIRFALLLSALVSSGSAFTSTGTSSAPSTQRSGATRLNMAADEVKVGDTLPSVVLQEGQPDYGAPKAVDLAELIKGKKVAIFAVPGAFTPGCSKSHLPSFIDAQDELKEKGVEMTICIATNDAFVMEAWGRSSGGSGAGIVFLSDPTAELSEKLGLVMDGFMKRTKRFSLIAEDGVVTHYFSSAEQSSDTWAPAVLSKL